MNVSELIERLEEFDPDSEVVLASDEEGNEFHAITDIEGGITDDEVVEGGVIDHIFYPDDFDDEGEYEDVLLESTPITILWP